jgi:murein DD-endopeptidase MepM/ murein hydrolase activator NlpD
MIDSALETLLNAKVASLPITNVTSSRLSNEIRIEPGEFNPQYIADEATLYKLLGMESAYSFTFEVKSITGEAIDCKLSAEVHATGTKTVEIPFETNYVDTDLRTAGYEKVVTAGANGTGVENYAYIYHDDVLVEETYLSTNVTEQPTDKVIERGVLNANKSVQSLGILSSPYPGRLSSGFGYREDGFHNGIDIIAISGSCYGQDVYAAMNGTVIQACYSSGLGNNVKIDNGNGLVITYAHLSKILVTKGQTVTTGDVVGKIGATGIATGPHLHFTVEDHGKAVNPLLYFKLN